MQTVLLAYKIGRYRKDWRWYFPGGQEVKKLPCNAEDMGSILGQETKISHASGLLSQCAATTEPVCSGARTLQLESLWPTVKIASAATKTWDGQINK